MITKYLLPILFIYTLKSTFQPQKGIASYLYAPWRDSYTNSYHHPKKETEQKTCPFCTQPKEKQDDKHFILKHYKHCFVILSLYPYNPGHLLVIPNAHVSELSKLSKQKRTNIMETINLCIDALKKAMNPSGFNIGLNIGETSGASLPDHLHFQILPRFKGDSGFLEVLTNTQLTACNLTSMYKRLKKYFTDTDPSEKAFQQERNAARQK